MIREEEMIRDKLRFFLDKDIEVHISIKRVMGSDKSQFYNGKIISIKDDRTIIFEDNYLGEVLIFLSEIEGINPKKTKKEVKNGEN